MSMFLHDLHATWRWAGARPGLVSFVWATLALTLGATTAVYTLVHAVLLQPLPVRDPGRLVWMWNARTERDRAPFSIPDFVDYRAGATGLAGLASFTNWTTNLTGIGDAERLEAVRVAPEFFRVIGLDAAQGRTLQPGDERTARVTVLTDRFWRRRFGADPSLVGGSITLNGAAYAVVGVLPRGFVFPFRDADLAVPLPLENDPRRGDRGANFLRIVARLKPGVTLDAAKANLDAIARTLQRQYPDDDARKIGVNLFPLDREIAGDARPLLWTLLGAVALMLLVASTNLANLLLASAAGRQREMGIRLAMGATSWRLARQVATETAVVVVAGGVAGLLLASGIVRIFAWWAAPSLPRLDSVSITAPVIGVGLLAMLGTAAVCTIAPVLHVSRAPAIGLATEGRAATIGARQQRAARGFVMLQIAASLVLLVTVAMSVRSFIALLRVDPGFRPAGVLSVQLSLPPARYPTREAIVIFGDRLESRLLDHPGVTGVGAVSLLPLAGLLATQDFRLVDRPVPPPDAVPQAHFRITTPGYFSVMGIAVQEGRAFDEADRETGQPVAVVNQTFARRFWPNGPAIGARLVLSNESTARTIVGIVADVKQFSLESPPTADLYVPFHQMPTDYTSQLVGRTYWVIRTSGDPAAQAAAVTREIHALDGEVATSSLRSLDQAVSTALAPRRFSAELLGVFGQAGLWLAALGVYAVTA